MRILLVMFFGFVLAACGQDYKEVHGIKIGAPISEVVELDRYDSIESCELMVFTNKNLEEKGSVRAILAVDNVVVGVLVNDDPSNFESRILKLQETYGEALQKEDDEEWVAFEDDVYRIEAHPVMTTYTTKNFYKKQKEISYGCN